MGGSVRRRAAVGSHGPRAFSWRLRRGNRGTAQRDRRHRGELAKRRHSTTPSPPWSARAPRSIGSSACSAWRGKSVTNPAYQALEREWQPKLAAAADEILFNQGLFQRIKAVYDALPASALEPDQMRLVTRIYEHFVRHGAQLTGETSSGCPRSIRSSPRGSPSSARRYSRTRTHRRSSRTAR